MLYSQSPPLAEKEWLTAEETSPGSSARDPDAQSDLRFGRRPLKAPIRSHPSRLNDREVASDRPSIGRAYCVALPGSLLRLSSASVPRLAGSRCSKGDGHSPGLQRWPGCYPFRRSRQSWLQLPLARCSSLSPWCSISISCGAA
jgi:hypothetical protein